MGGAECAHGSYEWIGRPCCMNCGYDLAGLPEDHFCPECGFGYQLGSINAVVRDELRRQSACATTAFLMGVSGTAVSGIVMVGQSGVVASAVLLVLAASCVAVSLRAYQLGAPIGYTITYRLWAMAALLAGSVLTPILAGVAAVLSLALGVYSLIGNATAFPHALQAAPTDALRRLRARRRWAFGVLVFGGLAVATMFASPF